MMKKQVVKKHTIKRDEWRTLEGGCKEEQSRKTLTRKEF
jgi:hypothetical protein